MDNLKAQCDSVLPGVKANLLVAQSMAEKILSRDSKSEIVSLNTDLSSSGATIRFFFKNSKLLTGALLKLVTNILIQEAPGQLRLP